MQPICTDVVVTAVYCTSYNTIVMRGLLSIFNFFVKPTLGKHTMFHVQTIQTHQSTYPDKKSNVLWFLYVALWEELLTPSKNLNQHAHSDILVKIIMYIVLRFVSGICNRLFSGVNNGCARLELIPRHLFWALQILFAFQPQIVCLLYTSDAADE